MKSKSSYLHQNRLQTHPSSWLESSSIKAVLNSPLYTLFRTSFDITYRATLVFGQSHCKCWQADPSVRQVKCKILSHQWNVHEIKVQIALPRFDSTRQQILQYNRKPWKSTDRKTTRESMCLPDEQLDGEFNIFLKMFLAKEYYISQAGNRTNKVEIHLRSIAKSPSVCVQGLWQRICLGLLQ